MENIAPPLELIWFVKRELQKGNSVRKALSDYVSLHSSSSRSGFVKTVAAWSDPNLSVEEKTELLTTLSPARAGLLRILERGLNREPIFPVLVALEGEIIKTCQIELEEKASRLSVWALLPVLGLQFPSLALLVLLPLVKNLVESLN